MDTGPLEKGTKGSLKRKTQNIMQEVKPFKSDHHQTGLSVLSGLKVVELASVLAGPSVGMFFAELGAQVIKVENPSTNGDVTRSWMSAKESPDSPISAYFSSVNWGKKSVLLNLSLPPDRRRLDKLLAEADILLVSYKPGDAQKFGLDYPALNSRFPQLIYGEITAYGQEDRRAGYDAILQAECGFTYINGQPDGPPTKMPVALVDVLAGHQLKEGLLLALLQRERTGKGACVSVSLQHAGVSALVNQAANWLVAGQIPQRMGSAHPNIAPYGTLFPCKNGEYIVLAVGSDAQFKSLCEVIGLGKLAIDPRYNQNSERVKNRKALENTLKDTISQIDQTTLLEALHKRKVPAGAVKNMESVFAQPGVQELIIEGKVKSAEPDSVENIEKETPVRGVRSAVFKVNGKFPGGILSAPPALGDGEY